MNKTHSILPLLSLCLILSSCTRDSDGSGRTGDRILTSDSVNIAGIRLGQSPQELRALLPALHCTNNDSEVCTFVTGPQDRLGMFRGINRVRCVFHRDSLTRIGVEYSEMLDMEYAVFDKKIRETYGPAASVKAPDSVVTEWGHGSLLVKLTPNRRPHWIGQITTYSPVLEFTRR